MADGTPGEHPPDGDHSTGGRRRALWGLGAALVLGLLLTMAVASGGAVLAGVDHALTDVTRAWADDLGWPVAASQIIGEVTEPAWSGLVAAVLVAAFAAARYQTVALLLALSAMTGVAVTTVMKLAVGRPRPPGAEAYASGLETSFPSGHSSAGIYIYLAAGLVLVHLGRARGAGWVTGLGRLLLVAGPLLGVTRLVLGVHWPSDILAGWAFGSAALLVAALLLWPSLAVGWVRDPPEARAGPVTPDR